MRVSVELDNKTRADGRCVVYLTAYHAGKLRRHQLSIRVKPSDWSENTKRVKFNAPNATAFNRAIVAALESAEGYIADNPHASADDVKAFLQVPTSKGLLLRTALEDVLRTQASRFTPLTAVSLRTVVRDIEACLPHSKLEALTTSNVSEYREHLASKGLASNTIRSRLRRLRILYRHACSSSNIAPADLFKGAIPREVEVAPHFLTAAQLEQLRTFEPSNERLRIARDAFLLSVYLGGMRFGDLSRLTRKHIVNGAVDYTMGKTDRPKWVPITSQAKEIMDRYTGPYILPLIKADTITEVSSANGTVNRSLKLIAATLQLPAGLSTHWARHTFAHWASSTGVPVNVIRMVLGHATLGTTTRYLARFDREAVVEVFGRLDRSIG